ncbi:hypothetical protein DPMN_182210 [Dreissena polymorpha]|uniref:Uncharacterized protein n=1 Tax=Dreissena polymorpha TaxID=45954 RepID=A0A9D4DFV5_DREPO|nr:hypothetical protein DPMN_182210 [Dreissena polymorpha]
MSLDKGSSRLSMRSTITAPQSHYYQVLRQVFFEEPHIEGRRPDPYLAIGMDPLVWTFNPSHYPAFKLPGLHLNRLLIAY